MHVLNCMTCNVASLVRAYSIKLKYYRMARLFYNCILFKRELFSLQSSEQFGHYLGVELLTAFFRTKLQPSRSTVLHQKWAK